MLTRLKKRVQTILAAEAKAAHKIGLTPNMISSVGIASALFSALAYAAWQISTHYILLAAFLLIFSGFCDALDGTLARLCSQTTVFGGFLDSVLDRYADAVVYTGIILGKLCEIPWGLAALVGSMLVSYTRSKAEAIGIKMESIGLAERAERIIILTIISLIATFWESERTMNYGLVLLAVLSNLTVLQRGLHVHRILKRKA